VTTRRAGWNELLFATLLAAGLLTVGLPPLPAIGLRVSAGLSAAIGALAGALLFCALAGTRARRPARERMRGLLGAAGLLLVGRASAEEVAWRGFLLGALVPPLGRAGALGLTSVAFALAHAGVRGRMRLVHVLTGSVFGGLYLASGRLGAAVAAHVVYNGLVVTARRTGA
jgi:membrane protease YdiL (CAAX protease family)